MNASPRLFSPALCAISGRRESGRWLRAMPADRAHDLLDPFNGESSRGGRVNPPGSFPVLYAAEDQPGCRPIYGCLCSGIPDAVIAVFHVSLSCVLDLTEPDLRRRLGITVRDLTDSSDPRIAHAVGVAAYNDGFDGIIYPRPWKPKCRNLAVFADRITSADISLLELRSIR